MKGKPSLIVKTSKIPNSGKGLFAKSLILKGTIIGEYKGKRVTEAHCERVAQKGKDIYIYDLGNGVILDGIRSVRCKTRYINDATGFKRTPGLSNNSRFKVDTKQSKVFVVAKRNIKPNEEIYASYGKDYWDTLKYNIKIDKHVRKSNTRTKG